MAHIVKRLFAPFEGWGTRFLSKISTDPFFSAQARLLVLCALLVLFLTLVNTALDQFVLRPTIYEALSADSPLSKEEASSKVERYVLYTRLIRTIVFLAVLYFIAEFAMRPVRLAYNLQRRFMANVSHELKTPLAVKKTATEIALRKGDALTRDDLIAVLKQNMQETDRLSGIVRSMIMLSDPKASHTKAGMSTVPLSSVINEAVTLMSEKAKNKNISLMSPFGEGQVIGNRTALLQLLANLIDNAISHTPVGGRVFVRTTPSVSGLVLSVEDNGTGIKEEDKQHIFSPFYRGANAFPGGRGLGLSIVQEIARAHGARVFFENLSPGTRFSVMFKKSPQH